MEEQARKARGVDTGPRPVAGASGAQVTCGGRAGTQPGGGAMALAVSPFSGTCGTRPEATGRGAAAISERV